MSYLVIKRDKRDDFNNATDRETIFDQNIEIFDVADDECTKINEKIDEKTDAVAEKNEKNFFDFLQCLMRTCSCSLILFENLTKQRLHENISIFFFVMRVFSTCCCLKFSKMSLKKLKKKTMLNVMFLLKQNENI